MTTHMQQESVKRIASLRINVYYKNQSISMIEQKNSW